MGQKQRLFSFVLMVFSVVLDGLVAVYLGFSAAPWFGDEKTIQQYSMSKAKIGCQATRWGFRPIVRSCFFVAVSFFFSS